MSNTTSQVRKLEADFERYRDALLHDWFKVLTTLGMALVPLFVVLDYFMMPRELLAQFAIYRVGATLAIALQHLAVRRTRPSKRDFLHGYVFSLVTGAMITVMTVQLGGFSSSYYAGLNLVVVAVNLLLPWHAVHSALNGLMVLVMYVAANLIFGATVETRDLLNNGYFMGATVVIAVALTHVRYRQTQEEFRLRSELQASNQNLDRSRQELKAARDALWGEMEVAKRIQTALLPPNRTLGNYRVAAAMLPALEVGGDYYDFLESPHGERWVAVGDVSGHGVESGLVMMMTQTSIATLACDAAKRAPSQVYAGINKVLNANIGRLGSGRYMTLNVLRLDEKKLTVAGKHQDLLVWRAKTRTVEQVATEGSWIGVLPDITGLSPDVEVALEPNDRVLLFTDGVTEALNGQKVMFGQERLAETFAMFAELAPDDTVARLMAAVTAWNAGPLEDDVTLVLIQAG